ncbi:MAG: rod shape-determining protein, partial [Abditibacteriota bacterium]|nr:rod shape-determining protein [Abditibacteriota bacterium]
RHLQFYLMSKNISTNKIIAIGYEAQGMIGRTPQNVVTTRPLKDGVISDFTTTRQMLEFIIREICKVRVFKPIIVAAVPSRITQVEKRAVRLAAIESGAREAIIVEEPWAAALGAGFSIDKPGGTMIVDIGGGTTDIAVLSMNGIVLSDSDRIGGAKFDDFIKKYVKSQYNLLIGDPMAEEIKTTVGSACELKEELKMTASGRDLIDGNPKSQEITSQEIRQVLAPHLDRICAKIKSILEKTPPDLCSDILKSGIVITGGTTLIRDFDKLVTQKTGVRVIKSPEPLRAVALGCGKALDMLDMLRTKFIAAGNE